MKYFFEYPEAKHELPRFFAHLHIWVRLEPLIHNSSLICPANHQKNGSVNVNFSITNNQRKVIVRHQTTDYHNTNYDAIFDNILQ